MKRWHIYLSFVVAGLAHIGGTVDATKPSVIAAPLPSTKVTTPWDIAEAYVRSHGTWNDESVINALRNDAANGVVTWSVSGDIPQSEPGSGFDGGHVGWPQLGKTVDFVNPSDAVTAASLILAATNN